MRHPFSRSALAAAGLLPWMARAADAAAPEAVSAAGSLLSVLAGLGSVLFLIGLLAWLAKRLGVSSHGLSRSPMKVAGSVSVGSREKVVIVEIGESWLVVGVAPGSISALATLPKGETPSQDEAPSLRDSFSKTLQAMIEKKHDKS